MALFNEKTISQFIESQFPEFYREEGSNFIAFIKAYYEWLESENQVLYHTRNLGDYRDIDNTIDQFILNFKNKYLPNIQFNTATNKELFIKNAREFYKAKGTPRAVDLFFKLVYGLEARIYYPGNDLFKLSDNEWRDTKYLELRPNPNNIKFVGNQIVGSISGATAFVERLVRVKKDTLYIEVLYLTDVNQHFVTDERIRTFGLGDNYSAKIDGSLTSFEVTFSDGGFKVGEEVYVADGRGKKAKAVVNQITDYVGVVDFELLEGGWGYTQDAEIIGSERVLRLDNITFEDTTFYYHTEPVRVFETLKQDLILLDLDTANDALIDAVTNLSVGTSVFAHVNDDPANTVIFEGKIVNVDKSLNEIVVNYTAENYLDVNDNFTIDLIGNTINSYWTTNGELEIPVIDTSNVTATGNVIAWDDNMTIEYSNDENLFLRTGDKLVQKNETYGHTIVSATVSNTFSEGTNFYANIKREDNWPRTNKILYRLSDGKEFTIQDMSNTFCGVIGLNGEIPNNTLYFYDTANTYASNTPLSFSSKNDSFSQLEKAIFQINEYEYTQSLRDTFSNEVISEMPTSLPDGNTFVIEDFNLLSNNDIWSDANGYPGFTSILEGGDSDFNTTPIGDFLNISTDAVEYGSVSAIVTTNPGRGYGRSPFFIVYEPALYHAERYDFYIKYTVEEELKAFRIGELLTVPLGDEYAKGILTEHDASTGEMLVTRIHLSSDIEDYAHLYTSRDFRNRNTIVGDTSGISASIEWVDEKRKNSRTGLNSLIKSEAFDGGGFVTSLRIINSGFGYFGKRRIGGILQDGEVLNLVSQEDSNKTIQAYGYLGKEGIGEGYHPNRKSFLSSDKYLHDNDFYQDYSYQVLTALPFEKYKQTLLEILHVAGTKPFGGYVGTSEQSLGISIQTETLEWDIKQFPLFVNENTFYSNTTITT